MTSTPSSAAARPASLIASAKAFLSGIWWSADSTAMTASGSSAEILSAAQLTAIAVFRLWGSTRIRDGLNPLSARIARACSWPHTIQIWSASAKARARWRVASRSVFPPTTRRKGFGRSRRDAGQKRSPAPPARITACTLTADRFIFLAKLRLLRCLQPA